MLRGGGQGKGGGGGLRGSGPQRLGVRKMAEILFFVKFHFDSEEVGEGGAYSGGNTCTATKRWTKERAKHRFAGLCHARYSTGLSVQGRAGQPDSSSLPDLRAPTPLPSGALEGKGPQRRPQRQLGRRLEEVAKAVGGGHCRLQMPLRLALGVRGTVAGRRLGALEGGAGTSPPSDASPPPPPGAVLEGDH